MLNDLIESRPFVMVTYVLSLKDECYYIGRSTNLNQRLAQHISKDGGALWTRLHDVVGLEEVHLGDIELEKTIEYFNRYGTKKVRGAYWCKEFYSPNYEFPKTVEDYTSRKLQRIY